MEKKYYAEYYQREENHWWFLGRRRILLALLHHWLGDRNPIRILDLGCGPGMMLQALAQQGCAVGVDMAPEALACCRDRGISEVVQADIQMLPFRSEIFDLVCALDIIEHLDDETVVLQEMMRLCRPGGYFLITVPAYRFLWGPHDEINHHKRRYTRQGLYSRLDQIGLRVRKLSYYNTFLFPGIAMVRLLARLIRRNAGLESDFYVPSGFLDPFFRRVFSSEATLLKHIDFPFGVSVLALAQKV